MLDNRERVGRTSFDFSCASLARKFSRRSFRITTDDEIFIREMNILQGALGCAVWDGAVICSRWIAAKAQNILDGRAVLELGCGAGLVGIVASRFANKTYLTDYISDVVENAAYNAKVNVPEETLSSVHLGILDWFQYLKSSSKILPHRCTKEKQHGKFTIQPYYTCGACFGDDDSRGVCELCYEAEHKTHDGSSYAGITSFDCDCQELHRSTYLSIEPHSVDVMLGSELTYSTLACEALADTVEILLKEEGVFYEVLSSDRDGVSVFSDLMRQRGFECYRKQVPNSLTVDLGTRKWCHQDKEMFYFYTWKKSKSDYPIMEV